ncbi:hypothetical protein ACFWN7_03955 [Agromyces sp. NPDC058484]|uniref:hypothetical protein n=1 Tax=Agromyces sp. NPDC058484 TaxID=3346524 RepID=UPI0036500AE9
MQADGAPARSGWPGILLIWVVALAGAIAVIVLAYTGTTDWFGDSTPVGVYAALGVVFATCVLLTLAAQLASRRPEGFVARTSSSIAGAVVVVALAALAAAPVVLV